MNGCFRLWWKNYTVFLLAKLCVILVLIDDKSIDLKDNFNFWHDSNEQFIPSRPIRLPRRQAIERIIEWHYS